LATFSGGGTPSPSQVYCEGSGSPSRKAELVRSVAAEGEWFFAYRADDALVEQTEGSVLVTGLWQGISCEYGRCAPEVEIQSIESLPVVPE
jgi:hypothetical protein